MKVVTSGLTFLDIDAYAGCVAYAELLSLQGHQAIAYSSATINDSVTKTIASWKAPFVTDYIVASEDTFVLIDVSEPDYLEKSVVIDRVEEVIDHHVGYESFWQDRLGAKANIEFIGAACTQVYESWVKAGLFHKMSQTSARLLICGILDNTLNFKAGVTTERDHLAYDALLAIANLPSDWTAQYFQECETSIFADIADALKNDTKMMQFKNLDTGTLAVGQLVLWDAQRAIGQYRSDVEAQMAGRSNDWFVNIVSISEGKSFFLVSGDHVASWAEKVMEVRFSDRLAIADRLWLRKEIVKQDFIIFDDEVDTLAKKLLGYMRLDMPVKKADVIIGMGTLDVRIAERTARLFLDGFGDLVVFTGGLGRITKHSETRPEAERFRDVAIAMGVPKDKILIETESTNTGDNIIFSQRLLATAGKDVKSIMCVTKPYMERRVLATFQKQWQGTQPEMIVTSPQISFEEHMNETISRDLFINVIVGDVQRIRLYADRGYQSAQVIPDDVWQAYERLVSLGYDKQLVS